MSKIILNELRSACLGYAEWAALRPKIDNPNHGLHLAVMQQPYLGYLLGGTKTIESRFSINKIAPFGQVVPGDLVLLKHGPIVGAYTAAWVESVQLSKPQDLVALQSQYGPSICASPEFWAAQHNKRFATLIGVSHVVALPPCKVTKNDMRGWVKLRS